MTVYVVISKIPVIDMVLEMVSAIKLLISRGDVRSMKPPVVESLKQSPSLQVVTSMILRSTSAKRVSECVFIIMYY